MAARSIDTTTVDDLPSGSQFDDLLNTPEGGESGNPKPEAAPTKAELDQLRKDLEAANKRIGELSDSEKFWANRARGGGQQTPEPEPDEIEDPDDQTPAPRESPYKGEKPDKFLDDVSAEGLGALLKRGVITQEQFDERLASIEERIERRITRQVEDRLALNARHTTVEAELAKYPDLQDPAKPLFQRASGYFKEAVAIDPNAKNSAAVLLGAIKRAKSELDLEAKLAKPAPNGGGDRGGGEGGGDRQAERRRRIDSQGGERTPSGRSEVDDTSEELSPTQRMLVGQFAKHLEVKGKDGKVVLSAEDNFRRHMGNGRGK